MRVDKFVNKLNKLDNNIYTIEEEVTVVNGQYKALLEHDNVKTKSINVYTGSMLTGTRINDVILSTPSSTPWKTEIQVFTDSTKIYITYETVGDTVEAEDINMLQDSIVYIQEESNKYQSSNDNKVSELTKNKVDKVQGKQLSTNDYTNTEKDKLSNIEDNANRYIHPNNSNIRHVTDVEKNTWNSKETVEGSQAKATKALNDAKAYVNTELTKKANTDHTHNYAPVSHGKHVPDACIAITDWNTATITGWYMAIGASNSPTTGTWYFGEVIAHNTNYVIQTVYQFTASTDAKAIPKYIRAKMNGTWGVWTNVTVAKAVPSNAVFTDTNTWRGIQDNLTSTSTTDSLSANQGKVLKGLIDSKANASHTHTKSQISGFPTKLSQFEDDLGVGQLPSRFTWNMLKGV